MLVLDESFVKSDQIDPAQEKLPLKNTVLLGLSSTLLIFHLLLQISILKYTS